MSERASLFILTKGRGGSFEDRREKLKERAEVVVDVLDTEGGSERERIHSKYFFSLRGAHSIVL